MEDREKDIQNLCAQVLKTATIFWDNPNGAYETTCPFCDAVEYRGGHQYAHADIKEINHNLQCAYLIAKDLSTGVI